LGSIVDGWILIVPRQHFISMGALPDVLASEHQRFRTLVIDELSTTYPNVCAFEHGACGPGRQVGCGVDHAHVHLVPLAFDLSAAAVELLPQGTGWVSGSISDCQRAFAQGLDYLFVEQPIGRGQIAVAPRFGSQILRKAIASAIGTPERFDWRQHPNTANISTTITKVRAQKSLLSV